MSRTRWAQRLAVVAAGGILSAGIALPATASPCNGSTTDPGCSDSVSGEVDVPASLTMILVGNSFDIPVNAGAVGNTPTPGNGNVVPTATVFTTNQKGYTFTEALSPADGFHVGSSILSGNVITPWTFSLGNGAWGGSGGWSSSPFGIAGNAIPVYATSGPNTDTAGNSIPMAWQVAPPATQAAGNYTGSISLLALANL